MGKRRKSVSVKRPTWGGDHGTGTSAAKAGTEIVPIKDSPNGMANRRRINVIDKITSLSMRQLQAAKEIEAAYCKTEMLSSGGPLKEQVDASPKPDAVVSSQVDAQSRLARCMRPVLRSERHIVECICWRNEAPRTLSRTHRRLWLSRFKTAMDRVADEMGY